MLNWLTCKQKVASILFAINWLRSTLLETQYDEHVFCSVDQLDKVKWQLEQERGQTFEQATKELKNVKMEVEANRSALQTRQKQVEAVVMEVLFTVLVLPLTLARVVVLVLSLLLHLSGR